MFVYMNLKKSIKIKEEDDDDDGDDKSEEEKRKETKVGN